MFLLFVVVCLGLYVLLCEIVRNNINLSVEFVRNII